MEQAQLDQLCINTLRTLSIDAVQKAQSGHPGTPMDAAPTAYCLWQRFLRYDPDDPDWPNRDRFVLSAGHACALLYSLLYLCGVKAKGSSYPPGDRLAVTLHDLMNFRQAGSRCTGHPEYGWTSGVETTTGPLGQGVATSVKARVISMPSWELFERQPQEYRDKILPPAITARVAVEEASTFGWERYTGCDGAILGLHTFGMSAPLQAVAQHFGFEAAHVVAAAKAQVARHSPKPPPRTRNAK